MKVILASFILSTFSFSVLANSTPQMADKFEKIRQSEKTVQAKFKAQRPILSKDQLKNKKRYDIFNSRHTMTEVPGRGIPGMRPQ